MPDIDLGPISEHQALIVAYALGMAIDSGELTLKPNYQAAVEVKAMLSLRLAQAEHEDAHDLSEVPDTDEGYPDDDLRDETDEDRRTIFALRAHQEWMAHR